jgi:hypothetical protein
VSGATTWKGRWAARLLAALAALALTACDAFIDVDATANVPPRYVRVLVTVDAIWFHEDADAPLQDENWEKHELDDGRTIDLVRLNGGTFAQLAGHIRVPAGTYRQMRLFLADTHGRLRDSAEDAGADYNNEVTWFDEDGDLHTAPLEVLDPAQGVGMELEIEVVEAFVTLGGSGSDNSVLVVFDGARDLTEVRYGGETRFLLNPTLRAHAPDTQDVGAIRGTLNLSQLPVDSPTGRPEVQVTAQRWDASAGRRVPVASSSVANGGQFVLYPLPLDEDERTTGYDLVIHGPGIQTVIIEEVPVRKGGLGAAVQIALGAQPLQPADRFEANVAGATPVAPRGARVGFYQTPQGEDHPFLVAMATVDPLSGRFAEPVRLSRAGTVLFGTYGPNLNLRAATPEEGAGRYAVALFSPHFGHGGFAAETLRPPGQSSDVALFSVPPITGVALPAVPGLISATVNVETPAKYDRGALLVTQEGALVTLAPLDELLQQQAGSAFVEVSPVPAGSEATPLRRGLYHLDAWTWNSADEEDTFRRHGGAAAVDLRTTANGEGELTVR